MSPSSTDTPVIAILIGRGFRVMLKDLRNATLGVFETIDNELPGLDDGVLGVASPDLIAKTI